jgi:hypothetical protein
MRRAARQKSFADTEIAAAVAVYAVSPSQRVVKDSQPG